MKRHPNPGNSAPQNINVNLARHQITPAQLQALMRANLQNVGHPTNQMRNQVPQAILQAPRIVNATSVVAQNQMANNQIHQNQRSIQSLINQSQNIQGLSRPVMNLGHQAQIQTANMNQQINITPNQIVNITPIQRAMMNQGQILNIIQQGQSQNLQMVQLQTQRPQLVHQQGMTHAPTSQPPLLNIGNKISNSQNMANIAIQGLRVPIPRPSPPQVGSKTTNFRIDYDEGKVTRCKTILMACIERVTENSPELKKELNDCFSYKIVNQNEKDVIERFKAIAGDHLSKEDLLYLEENFSHVANFIKNKNFNGVVQVNNSTSSSQNNTSIVINPSVPQTSNQYSVRNISVNQTHIHPNRAQLPASFRVPNIASVVAKNNVNINNVHVSTNCQQIKGGKRKHSELDSYEQINDVTSGLNIKQEVYLNNTLPANRFLSDKKLVIDDYVITDLLKKKLESILAQSNLTLSADVLNVMSLAARQFHASILSDLSKITNHRLTIYKGNENYNPTYDVRRQIKFYQEKIKNKLKRNEGGDSFEPKKSTEHGKGSINIDESNNAALQAIGSKKKSLGNLTNRKSSFPSQPRVRRANLNDLIAVYKANKFLKSTSSYYKACCSRK